VLNAQAAGATGVLIFNEGNPGAHRRALRRLRQRGWRRVRPHDPGRVHVIRRPGCVDNPFRWCDTIDNVDPSNFTLVSKAFGDIVIRMAMDNRVMSSSGNALYKKLPIAGEVGRRFSTK
jgi:hypothetical protein